MLAVGSVGDSLAVLGREEGDEYLADVGKPMVQWTTRDGMGGAWPMREALRLTGTRHTAGPGPAACQPWACRSQSAMGQQMMCATHGGALS